MRDNNRPYRGAERPYGAEMERDGSLSDLLDRCGHYYTHRIGGSHRGQNSALTWLAEHPNATQKELGEELGITPASLSEVLMKLERKGYVERFKDESDRRFIRVQLTEEGISALDALEEKGIDPFTVLSEDEQETLKGLLSKLLNDWEARCPSDRSRRRVENGRDFSRHGNEHPGHGDEHPGHDNEHPGHDNEHPGHGRDGRADRSGHDHGRDTSRRGHGR